jgi:hypothetical protein
MSMEDITRRLSYNAGLRQGASPDALGELQRQLGARLPSDYLAFMSESDGAYGFVGTSYVALSTAQEVIQEHEAFSEFAQGLVFFGSDGAEEAYAFDARDGSMRVVQIPYEELGFAEPLVLADTFTEFLQCLERQ